MFNLHTGPFPNCPDLSCQCEKSSGCDCSPSKRALIAFAYSDDFPDKMSFEQRLWCIGKIRAIGDATVQLSPDCLSKLTSRELAGATLPTIHRSSKTS